jgi:hypothetical protein
LQVIVPEGVQPGHSFKVVVEALDASNHIATGYTGTVTLSLGTPDGSSTLPLPYAFVAGDHGVHSFTVTLGTAQSETIDASGTTSGSPITGAATTVVSSTPVLGPHAASQLLVITPEQAAVGVHAKVTVVALDAAGHVVPGFNGIVSLTSSDGAATASPSFSVAAKTLPLSYTFTRADQGVHTFQFTFGTGVAAGTAATVTATTTPTGGSPFSGQGALTVYPATTVTHFAIIAASSEDDCGGAFAVTGTPAAFTVEALNAANQIVTGYTGTVSFTSSDTTATVSATKTGTPTSIATFTYPFVAADNGKHVFYVTFDKTGQQTLTVTDTTTSSATGTITVGVGTHFFDD